MDVANAEKQFVLLSLRTKYYKIVVRWKLSAGIVFRLGQVSAAYPMNFVPICKAQFIVPVPRDHVEVAATTRAQGYFYYTFQKKKKQREIEGTDTYTRDLCRSKIRDKSNPEGGQKRKTRWAERIYLKGSNSVMIPAVTNVRRTTNG